MANIYAIVGGSSSASFPVDSNCPKCVEFCGEIDGRFASASGFSNPALFNPALSVPLKNKMESVAAGDIVWRNYIPWEHCARTMAVHVQEIPEDCCPDRRCCSGDPAGMELSVVTQKVDYAAFCEAGACNPDDYLVGSPNVVTAITDVTTHAWSKHNLAAAVGTVAAGEVLLYGFRIDALPTDASAVKCLNLAVAATVVGDRFSHPLQMD